MAFRCGLVGGTSHPKVPYALIEQWLVGEFFQCRLRAFGLRLSPCSGCCSSDRVHRLRHRSNTLGCARFMVPASITSRAPTPALRSAAGTRAAQLVAAPPAIASLTLASLRSAAQTH